MESPLVSVIVPNYNYASYLDRRLSSILNQTFRDYEIIILDDCSTDNSREVIEKYRSNPKVSAIVYNEKNTGSPFVQWEKGLSMAKGKYAWIAEADDLAEPTFLQRLTDAIRLNPQTVLACSMSKIIDENDNLKDPVGYDTEEPCGTTCVYRGTDFISCRMFSSNGVYNASMVLFSIDAFKKITNHSYRSMRYCGDWLFWIGILEQGNIAQVKEKLNFFRKHGHSVSDEGQIKSGNPRKETLCIQRYLMDKNLLRTADERKMLQYRYIREHLRKGSFTAEDLHNAGIDVNKFRQLSFYRHWLRWIVKPFCRCKALKPILEVN